MSEFLLLRAWLTRLLVTAAAVDLAVLALVLLAWWLA
jgi:hypothetical protein